MRLIDADAKALEQRINNNFGSVTRFIIKSILKDAPTIDAEPVKYGRWVVNPESYDGFKHHMCSNCKNDAIFDYVYEADFDEMLDGEWDYIGQRESGISEHLTKRCPNCDAKMDVTDTNVGDKENNK